MLWVGLLLCAVHAAAMPCPYLFPATQKELDRYLESPLEPHDRFVAREYGNLASTSSDTPIQNTTRATKLRKACIEFERANALFPTSVGSTIAAFHGTMLLPVHIKSCTQKYPAFPWISMYEAILCKNSLSN